MKRIVPGWCSGFAEIPALRKVVVLIVTPLLLASTAATAAGGRMTFSGQVSNGSCAVVQATPAAPGEGAQRVMVTRDMTLVVDRSRNACAGQVIPLTAEYRSIPVFPAVGQTASRGAGLVILTYQ
jgi:hypothetical protein